MSLLLFWVTLFFGLKGICRQAIIIPECAARVLTQLSLLVYRTRALQGAPTLGQRDDSRRGLTLCQILLLMKRKF